MMVSCVKREDQEEQEQRLDDGQRQAVSRYRFEVGQSRQNEICDRQIGVDTRKEKYENVHSCEKE